MNAASLIHATRQRSARLENYPLDLRGFQATTPLELAQMMFQSPDLGTNPGLPKPVNRSTLADLATAFHQRAGTMTDSVSVALAQLASGARIIRAAHQPNILPYMGVLGQLFLLDAVAVHGQQEYSASCCQMFFIVDHDSAGDKRFRVSRFPSARHRDGSAALRYPLEHAAYERMNLAIEKPPATLLNEWLSEVRRITVDEVRLLRRMGIHEHTRGQVDMTLEVIDSELVEAWRRSSNLSEFNAIFLSRLTNLYWELPTIFLPLSASLPSMHPYVEYLVELYPDLVSAFQRRTRQFRDVGLEFPISSSVNLELLPFWFVCTSCRSRVPLRAVSPPRLIAKGRCPSCFVEYSFDLGSYAAPDLDGFQGKIVPRVLLDNLLDLIGIGISGGVGYIGGAEHVLASALIASDLGWRTVPECLWRPFGAYFGSAEILAAAAEQEHPLAAAGLHPHQVFELVATGRASLIYYLLGQGINGISQMWHDHFDNGNGVDSVGVGRPRFAIGQDISGVVQKAATSLLRQEIALDF